MMALILSSIDYSHFQISPRKGDFADDQVAHLIASGSESENEEENEEAARKWRAKFAGILDDDQEKKDTKGQSLKNKKNENEKEFTIEADLEEDQGSDCLLSDEENNLSDDEVNRSLSEKIQICLNKLQGHSL